MLCFICKEKKMEITIFYQQGGGVMGNKNLFKGRIHVVGESFSSERGTFWSGSCRFGRDAQ